MAGSAVIAVQAGKPIGYAAEFERKGVRDASKALWTDQVEEKS